MFKTSDRTSLLIILFQFIQNYIRHCSTLCDVFLPFSTSTFIATPSPEKKIAYKTFFALKDRLATFGCLMCLVAQILMLTYLRGSK